MAAVLAVVVEAELEQSMEAGQVEAGRVLGGRRGREEIDPSLSVSKWRVNTPSLT